MESPQTSSVRNLETLYSVVIGLGLSLGITNLVDANRAPIPLRLGLLPYFASYLVTLIPFYHGALRHLDATYIEKGGKQARSGALLLDFLVLFIESCLFFALAVLLPSPQLYAWGLVSLLSVDIVWGFLAHVAFSNAGSELKWAYINLITVVLLSVVLILLGAFPPSAGAADGNLAVVVLIVSLGRSAVDYGLNWHVYYPSK